MAIGCCRHKAQGMRDDEANKRAQCPYCGGDMITGKHTLKCPVKAALIFDISCRVSADVPGQGVQEISSWDLDRHLAARAMLPTRGMLRGNAPPCRTKEPKGIMGGRK